jgi:hypothetical protein
MNAADPASPAGLDVEGVVFSRELRNEVSIRKRALRVRRVPSSRLCFRGTELLAVSNRGGKELEIFVEADDPDIAEIMAFVKFPRTRRVMPENKITVEKVNGASAAGSEFFHALSASGFVKDRGRMILW